MRERWRPRSRDLLSHTHKEVRDLGALLKQAATVSRIQRESGIVDRSWWKQIRAVSPELAARRNRNCCAKSESRRRW